ncbi:MAG: SCO family protein [Gammaproteobacteria bacterium]|nr:SCO family protein [Gammaproteobacteria bacterium]
MTNYGVRLVLALLLVPLFFPFTVEGDESTAQESPTLQDSMQEKSPQEAEGGESPPGGGFTLQSSTGPVSLEDLRGKVVLLYFGYASCPDVCPLDLYSMAAALDDMDDKTRARVQGIFVSVDPQRDTPEKLAEYTEFLHPNILGLTADEKTLREVATRYGVQYHRVELKGSDLPYAVNHSAATYLIDPEGTLRFIFPHNTPTSVLLEASEYVLAQYAGNCLNNFQ